MTQQQLEEKMQVRKKRDLIAEATKMLQQKIKDKKRKIAEARKENKDIAEKVNHQTQLNERLKGVEYMQTQMSKQGDASTLQNLSLSKVLEVSGLEDSGPSLQTDLDSSVDRGSPGIRQLHANNSLYMLMFETDLQNTKD